MRDIRDSITGQQIMLLAVSALCGVLAIVLVFFSTAAKAEYDEKHAENIQQISTLRQELNSMQDPTKIEQASQLDLSEAGTAGDIIAEAQTAYQTMKFESAEQFEADVKELADTVGEHLDSTAGDMAAVWYNPDLYEKAGLLFPWKFESRYEFVGGSIPVLWTCRDEEGNLCAYVTGTYTAATKKFSGLKKGITMIGQGYIEGTFYIDPTSPNYQDSVATAQRLDMDSGILTNFVKNMMDFRDVPTYNGKRAMMKSSYGFSDDSEFLNTFLPADLDPETVRYEFGGAQAENLGVDNDDNYRYAVVVTYDVVSADGTEEKFEKFWATVTKDGRITDLSLTEQAVQDNSSGVLDGADSIESWLDGFENSTAGNTTADGTVPPIQEVPDDEITVGGDGESFDASDVGNTGVAPAGDEGEE